MLAKTHVDGTAIAFMEIPHSRYMRNPLSTTQLTWTEAPFIPYTRLSAFLRHSYTCVNQIHACRKHCRPLPRLQERKEGELMSLCGFGCSHCGRCGEDRAVRFGIIRIPGKCPVCGFINEPRSEMCSRCGAFLRASHTIGADPGSEVPSSSFPASRRSDESERKAR
jgi:hypothetical protein